MMNRPISDDLELVAYFVEVEDFVCVCVCVLLSTLEQLNIRAD